MRRISNLQVRAPERASPTTTTAIHFKIGNSEPGTLMQWPQALAHFMHNASLTMSKEPRLVGVPTYGCRLTQGGPLPAHRQANREPCTIPQWQKAKRLHWPDIPDFTCAAEFTYDRAGWLHADS